MTMTMTWQEVRLPRTRSWLELWLAGTWACQRRWLWRTRECPMGWLRGTRAVLSYPLSQARRCIRPTTTMHCVCSRTRTWQGM
jgi:hypothetical protein